MIKVFVLIMSMTYQGSAIDHVEFDVLEDCEAAGQAFVDSARILNRNHYICVTKNKVQK